MVRPLDLEVTETDVTQTWRCAQAQVAFAKRARLRPPLGQPEGLEAFGPALPFGATRRVGVIDTVTPSGRP